MVGTLLLLSLQTQPITLTAGPDQPQKVLDQLGQAMGRKLVAGKTVEDEVLLVKFTNRPPAAVLATFAEGLKAEWKEGADGTLTLDRALPPRQFSELSQAQEAAISSWLLSSKGYQSTTFTPQEIASLDADTLNSADNKPLGENSFLLHKLVAQLDPQDLVRNRGKTVWYANVPGRYRSPFNAAQLSILNQLERFWSRPTATRSGKAGPGNPFYALRLQLLVSEGHVSLNGALYRWEGPNTKVASLSSALYWVGMLPNSRRVIPPARGVTEPFAFGPETVRLWADGMAVEEGIGYEDSRKAWREALSDPENREPLAYFATELPLALAEAKGKDLFAVVQDDLFFFGRTFVSLPDGPITIEDWFSRLGWSYGLQAKETQNTLIFGEDGSRSGLRIDRKLLKKALDYADQVEDWGLDELLRIREIVGYGESADRILRLVQRSFRRAISKDLVVSGRYRLMLDLYGTLSPDERTKVKNGGFSIPFGMLGPKQRAAAEAYFLAQSVISPIGEEADQQRRRRPSYELPAPLNPQTIPALALTNGIPNDAEVRIGLSHRDVIWGRRSSGRIPDEPQPITGPRSEYSPIKQARQGGQPLNLFAVVPTQVLDLQLVLSPKQAILSQWNISKMAGSSWGSFDQLPPEGSP